QPHPYRRREEVPVVQADIEGVAKWIGEQGDEEHHRRQRESHTPKRLPTIAIQPRSAASLLLGRYAKTGHASVDLLTWPRADGNGHIRRPAMTTLLPIGSHCFPLGAGHGRGHVRSGRDLLECLRQNLPDLLIVDASEDRSRILDVLPENFEYGMIPG